MHTLELTGLLQEVSAQSRIGYSHPARKVTQAEMKRSIIPTFLIPITPEVGIPLRPIPATTPATAPPSAML